MGGNVDTEKSSYLVLLWNKKNYYQLFQFSLALPEYKSLKWSIPLSRKKEGGLSRRVIGETREGVLFEWYGESGGQLKYYPFVKDAIWFSDRFNLEELPDTVEYGIIAKAKRYFPEKWRIVAND